MAHRLLTPSLAALAAQAHIFWKKGARGDVSLRLGTVEMVHSVEYFSLYESFFLPTMVAIRPRTWCSPTPCAFHAVHC